MSQPFLGEIRMVGFNFAPRGWAFCAGQLLPISQYDALFALIGTIYGGDGQSTFALPNMAGRLPVHQGQGLGLSNYVIGQAAGTETVTLIAQQMPQHAHPVGAASGGTRSSNPMGNMLGSGEADMYTRGTGAPVSLAANAIGTSGGNQPHDNMQPYLCINFVIALEGVFPSRN
ncbi:phage tail protein [Dokdonella sp.]|uniref:phage tail protein n=1 Tax=Dokdonella sp. TaxID=2291710 RepID=UPI002F40BAA0